MNDDARKVSAREWRAVREGDTHAAPKTSPNNTPESFIVGVGASGALLAGAAIVFVTLVGLVSFNVWPTAQDASTDGNVELSAATPSAPAHSTVAPLSAAAGLVASTNVGPPTGGPSGGGNGGGKNPGGKGNPKPGPAPTPPTTSPAPPDTGTGDGSTGSGPVTAIKDPSVAVTPTHPSNPHQSTSTGEKGKDPADEGDGGVSGIIGKPPIVKPPAVAVTQPDQTPPSSGSDGDNGDDGSTPPDDNDDGSSQGGDGHGCSHSHHHGD